MFHSWSSLLPEFELGLVHLPGRDKRLREPLHTELLPLVDELVQDMVQHLDRPFAFYGHSMGALLAFEAARQLRRIGAQQPVHLFLSSRRPPHKPDPHADLYRLPHQEFLAATERLYGALPEIVRQDPELFQLFLSILRADFTMLGTYHYQNELPLDSSISMFGGAHDPSVSEDELNGWGEQTTARFDCEMFSGDHFFIQQSRQAVIEQVRKISSSLFQ